MRSTVEAMSKGDHHARRLWRNGRNIAGQTEGYRRRIYAKQGLCGLFARDSDIAQGHENQQRKDADKAEPESDLANLPGARPCKADTQRLVLALAHVEFPGQNATADGVFAVCLLEPVVQFVHQLCRAVLHRASEEQAERQNAAVDRAAGASGMLCFFDRLRRPESSGLPNHFDGCQPAAKVSSP